MACVFRPSGCFGCLSFPLRPSANDSCHVRFRATTVMPYEHLERATAGLRAELRRQLLAADVHEMPLWETFTVEGPFEIKDARGRVWYEARASVSSRKPFDQQGRGLSA
jgi:hypothetical protein